MPAVSFLTERRALVAILALAFLIFAPTLANGFTLDDVFLAQGTDPQGNPDPILDGLRAPWWYFGERYWEGTNTTTVLYRPVTILSFALIYNLIAAPFLPAAAEALPQHLANVLLHTLAVLLVWRWLKALGVASTAALLGAAVFSTCGVHSEVVAGIVGRAELLALVLGLQGVLLFLRGRSKLAGVAFFFAFCSKESALAWAPFLVCHLLAQRWLAGEVATLAAVLRTHARALAVAIGPALALFFVLRGIAVAEVEHTRILYQENPLAHVDALTRVLTAIKIVGFGAFQTFLPSALSSVYGPGSFTLATTPADLTFFTPVLWLALWLAAALAWRRTQPLLFLSAAAFFGFAFLTSNIPFAIGTIFAERLLYAPSLGACLLAALLVSAPQLARMRTPLLVALLLGCAAHAAVIVTRNGAWRDNLTLFTTDADRFPRNAELQVKAAAVVVNTDEPRALRYLERAIAADPELPTAYGLRARIHQRHGDVAAADADYRRTLACRLAVESGEYARAGGDFMRYLMTTGRNNEAYILARTLLERDPDLYLARLAQLDLAAGAIPVDEYAALLDAAARRHAGDPRIGLRMAVFAYENKRGLAGNPSALSEALANVLHAVPANELDQPSGVRGRTYLAEILVEQGRPTAARPWLEGLLRSRALTPEWRARVEALAQRAK